MPTPARLFCLAALTLSAGAAHADVAGQWNFTFVQAQSGLSAAVDASADTSGTLIGSFDAATNPAGTRTKPGLFGTFGADENVAVNVGLSAGLGGNLATQTAGGFSLEVDPSLTTISVAGYSANLLGNGPASLPVTIGLSSQGFRTRNPTFLYPPGSFNVPIGEASVTTLSLSQAGPASLGALTPTGPGTYSFTVGLLVNVAASFSVLGNTLDLPGQAPIPFALTGTLAVSGQNATITSVTPLLLDQSAQPNLEIPQFPLALPTLSDPANVLMNLTLANVGLGLDGTLSTTATGVLIPTPGALALLALAGIATARRRR